MSEKLIRNKLIIIIQIDHLIPVRRLEPVPNNKNLPSGGFWCSGGPHSENKSKSEKGHKNLDLARELINGETCGWQWY